MADIDRGNEFRPAICGVINDKARRDRLRPPEHIFDCGSKRDVLRSRAQGACVSYRIARISQGEHIQRVKFAKTRTYIKDMAAELPNFAFDRGKACAHEITAPRLIVALAKVLMCDQHICNQYPRKRRCDMGHSFEFPSPVATLTEMREGKLPQQRHGSQTAPK